MLQVSAPQEIDESFYYSKPRIILNLIVGFIVIVAVICVSCFLFFNINTFESFPLPLPIVLIVAVFSIISIIVTIYESFIELKDDTPQLKITEQGIWSKEDGLYDWKEITDAYLAFKPSFGKSRNSRGVQLIIKGKDASVLSIIDVQVLKDYSNIDFLITKYIKNKVEPSFQDNVKEFKMQLSEFVKLFLIAVPVFAALFWLLNWYLFKSY